MCYINLLMVKGQFKQRGRSGWEFWLDGSCLVLPSVFISFWVTHSTWYWPPLCSQRRVSGSSDWSHTKSILSHTHTTAEPVTACCCGPYLFRRSHYIGGVKHQQVNFSLQSGQQALDLKAATIQIKLDSDLNKSVLKIFSHVFQRGGSTYRQFFFMQMQFIWTKNE